MLTKMKIFIEKYKLMNQGDNILVACSGGPDSLALAHVLFCLQPEYGINMAVAHVDHMFRGAESEADAAFVADFCESLGLRCYLAAIDVPRYIRDWGQSPQEAARILRYRYLRQVADQMGGAKIATGHHRGDQAETILLNLFRGAGSTGLAGMKPSGGGLIRPLLEITRSEIDDYCHENGLMARLDSSNLKPHYLRNYLRIEIMPLIEQRCNVNLAETLCRTARLIGDEHEYIAEQAHAYWPVVVQEEHECIQMDCNKLNLLHIAVRREFFRMAIAKKRGNLKGITFFHVERLLEMAMNGTVGSVIELPGNLIARRGYQHIIFETPSLLSSPAGIVAPGIELKVPGMTDIPLLGLTVDVRLLDFRPESELDGSAVFPLEQLSPPFYVRTRRAGDRFRPFGAPGSKKLKDFFIDSKIPREIRDHIPLFCDCQGIFWVGGYRRAQRNSSGEDSGCFLQFIITAGGSSGD